MEKTRRPSSKILGLRRSKGFERKGCGYRMTIRNECVIKKPQCSGWYTLAENSTVKGHKSSCHGSLSLCLMDMDNYPYPSGQMRLLRMDLPGC